MATDTFMTWNPFYVSSSFTWQLAGALFLAKGTTRSHHNPIGKLLVSSFRRLNDNVEYDSSATVLIKRETEKVEEIPFHIPFQKVCCVLIRSEGATFGALLTCWGNRL